MKIKLQFTLLCLLLPGYLVAGGAVGFGDGVLHLGTNGYASLADNQFQGFDYQTNFSLEAVLNIEAHTVGGRWAILLGKHHSPPFNYPGFALSIADGQFKSLGQKVYATVADGAKLTEVYSRSFQGIVYATMTWDCAAKVLTLYINGGREGSSTNALLTGSLTNSEPFKLGGASVYGQRLQRDVLLARLWNRVLTAQEVGTLWTNWSAGQSALGGVFNRTNLVSEWLMQELADATHLKDSQGNNPLQLQGSAQLWQGNGLLAAQFPADGATNMASAVTLQVAGGADTLGAGVVRPLRYYFEIDETNSFNSSARKSSGWLAGYGQWKPILKPSTTYYWRARVQDATPTGSDFVFTNSFTTRAPRDWYVRPGVYAGFDGNSGSPLATAGVYGQQNGTSYSNAWNGIFSIVWGETGVGAGDNLYVCGPHIYTASNIVYISSQGVDYISESGYSSSCPITIRMDSPSEAGSLWGACVNRINNGGTWSGPDANGVYCSSNLQYTADYWTDGTNITLLNRATATTWTNNPGNSFTTNGVWYVKGPDGSNPTGKICTSGFGYRFHFGRAWYLRFLNCKFYNATPGGEWLSSLPSNDTQTALPVSSYITFDNCTLRYAASISLSKGNDYWTIKNSEIADSPYGIYTFLNKHDVGANYLTVQSNYIHNIGTERFPHIDAHGVAAQGGEGHLVEANHIENTGAAIEYFTVYQPMRNHTFRYNFIKNIRIIPGGTDGGGITISGDTTYSVPGLRTGFKIYGNVIMNTGLGGTNSWQGYGIVSGSPDFVDIYNNVVYQSLTGIGVLAVNNPAQARVVNNIVVNATNKYVNIVGSGTSTNLLVDYNLYYPASSSTTAQFTVPYSAHDQHSVFAPPLFVSTAPAAATDFRLAPNSRAIGAGTLIDPLYNFGGSPLVPNGGPPDIGAFEDFATDNRPKSPSNLHAGGS